jgi:hypothetical protein
MQSPPAGCLCRRCIDLSQIIVFILLWMAYCNADRQGHIAPPVSRLCPVSISDVPPPHESCFSGGECHPCFRRLRVPG